MEPAILPCSVKAGAVSWVDGHAYTHEILLFSTLSGCRLTCFMWIFTNTRCETRTVQEEYCDDDPYHGSEFWHMIWWFGRTQNKATTRQPGILCGWSGCLEQSPTAHSFRTYYQRSKTFSRHICSLVPTSLTVSRVRAANIVRCPCSVL